MNIKKAPQPALRAVIYTRVSTGEQAENGTSLAGQLEACRAKAQAIDAQVVSVYEDAGISGALYRARHGMQAALRDLEAGKADTLIIANLSRFSRDREHQSAIKKRVDSVGARLVFCDMEFADSPEGDLAFGIMGTFADYERKVIRERTMKGRRRHAEQGIQPCRNHSPFGYHMVTSKDVLSGAYAPELLDTYQVIEEQARWVKEIFQRFAGGQSLRSVARWLTSSKVLTPRGNTNWNQTTLFRLLQHPVYKGQAPFGRFERHHDENRIHQGFKTGYTLVERLPEHWVCMEAPAIVDEATWTACQNRFQHNRDVLRGRPERKYLLTGLMRCPQCGRKMRSNRKRLKHSAYSFYECRFARPSSNTQGEACHKTQYRGEWAEPLVIKAINEVARHPEFMHAAVQAYRQAQTNKRPQSDIAKLHQQMANLERQEQATVRAQVAGIMAGADTNVYESLLRDIAAQRAQITEALAHAGMQSNNKKPMHRDDDVALVARALADVNEVLNAPDTELSPAEKQGFLARVVGAIYPNEKEGLRIDLKPLLASFGSANALNVQYFTT